MLGEQMIDRSWRSMRRWFGADTTVIDRDLGPEAERRLNATLHACLTARGGEVSARARAVELGQQYLTLSALGRQRFLTRLAVDFDLDPEAAREAARRFADGALDADRLRETLQPQRVKVLSQFTSLPQGVKFLVDLRAEVLKLIDGGDAAAALKGLDRDLKALLSQLFDVGLLELKRITWDSPASLLESLFASEAVHRIRSWHDLRDRLDSDRRVYAFFHPRMPHDPLIVLNVALSTGIADSIQAVLDEAAPVGNTAAADTALFYSISNAQAGLRGIGFGNFLIKQAVDTLRREFEGLTTFSTLSPMPGFARWLAGLSDDDAARHADPRHPSDPRPLLQAGWHDDADLPQRLRPALLRLGAVYLLTAKRGGLPVDPVARFHLGNGAIVHRLNHLGDVSPKGLAESHGLMVNYRYDLASIEANHEALETSGTVVASDAVKGLIEAPRRLAALFGRTG